MKQRIFPPGADPRLPRELRRELNRLRQRTPSRRELAVLAAKIRTAHLEYQGKSIDEWLGQIEEGRLSRRWAHSRMHQVLNVFCQEIGLTGLPILLEDATQQDSLSRQQGALLLLAWIPARASLSVLMECLRSHRVTVRLYALLALCELEQDGAEACGLMLQSLRANDVRERALAARALRWMPPSERLLEPLLEAANDSELWVRQEAALALGEFGPMALAAALPLAEWAALETNEGEQAALGAARIDPAPVIRLLSQEWSQQKWSPRKKRFLGRLKVLGPLLEKALHHFPPEPYSGAFAPVFAQAGAAGLQRVPELEKYLDLEEREDLCQRIQRQKLLRALKASPSDLEIHNPGWLQKQVEQKRLHPERLHLAALCGLNAAREALGLKAKAQDLESWLENLAREGLQVSGRAVFALGRQVLPYWEAAHPDDLVPRGILEEFPVWLVHPSAIGEYFLSKTADFRLLMGTGCIPAEAAKCLQSVAYFPRGDPADKLAKIFKKALGVLRNNLENPFQQDSDVLEQFPARQAAQRLRTAIEQELLGWALGLWDPVGMELGFTERPWLSIPDNDVSQPLLRHQNAPKEGNVSWWLSLEEYLERDGWEWEESARPEGRKIALDQGRIHLDWNANTRLVELQHFLQSRLPEWRGTDGFLYALECNEGLENEWLTFEESNRSLFYSVAQHFPEKVFHPASFVELFKRCQQAQVRWGTGWTLLCEGSTIEAALQVHPESR